MRPQIRKMIPILSSQQYWQKVMATIPGAYLRMDELSGAAALDATGGGHAGTYHVCTLGQPSLHDGGYSVQLNGVTSFIDLWAALKDIWNGQLFSFMVWAKFPAAVWTDNTTRDLWTILADGANYFKCEKQNDNKFMVEYQANGTDLVRYINTTTTDAFSLLVTVNLASNRMRVYFNGAQVGADVPGLGAWAGALNAGRTMLGASADSFLPMPCWLDNAAYWARELTPAEAQQIGSPI